MPFLAVVLLVVAQVGSTGFESLLNTGGGAGRGALSSPTGKDSSEDLWSSRSKTQPVAPRPERQTADTTAIETMTRYNDYSGNGGSTDNDQEFDDITVKLQQYAALKLTPTRVNVTDTDWGDRLIAGFEDTEVLDGIVFQRDDREDTWKVFSPKKFFNVGPDGLVYESYDADNDEYEGEMSAEDVLAHPRVQGFSETFGGDSYWYTPVGVVIEEGGPDIATNDDLDVETSDDGIVVGESSMLLGNKSWVRTFAKLLSTEGNDIVATTENDDGDTVPVSDDHGWLTTDEPALREDLDGRALELFVIEESADFGDGNITYTTPVLLDSKTGNRVTIDNGISEDDGAEDPESEAEAAEAVTDGGAAAEVEAETDSDTESPESPSTPGSTDETESDSDDGSTDEADTEDLPEALDDLLDYFARTQDGDVEPDELREFAESEVDDPDDVDWEAAAAECKRRA